MDAGGIPAELRAVPSWVRWRFEKRNGRVTKVPLQSGKGCRARSDDPQTWSTFEAACVDTTGDGIGFMFGPPWTGVDLDACIEDGRLHPEAVAIVRRLDSYTETSVSGHGVHIIVRGRITGDRHRTGQTPWGGGQFEAYSERRFFCMTGARLPEAPATTQPRQAELDQLLGEMFPASPNGGDPPKPAPRSLELDDEKLLALARAAKNGVGFDRLWHGDTGNDSHSEADLALCNMLAFWTQGDATRVDQLFRRSGLMRAKWNERRGKLTYGELTISKALEGRTEFYEPHGANDRDEPAACGGGVSPLTDVEPRSLEQVVDTFSKWLFLPDPGVVIVPLAAVAANRLPGDPVWPVLVGPPGAGKSEALQAISGLEDVHPASTLTEPALLSGSSKRDRSPNARGGLLRQIGERGIIVSKDFGSVLNMRREDRASVLAALREVYDGAWTRHVGTDGGQTLHWTGRVGFIGGATPGIDRHHALMSSMGERFIFYRLPSVDEDELAHRALRHAGHEEEMRRELAEAVNGLFVGDELPCEPRGLAAHERDWLVQLTTLVVRARSAVERDSYSREIELVPGSEAPTRLVIVLDRLLAGLDAIGLERSAAWGVIRKVAFDSVPALRRSIIELLAATDEQPTTTEVAAAVRYPTATTRRALEDLTAHGVGERHTQGKGKADRWSLSDWTRARYALVVGVPEMSGSVQGGGGPVPEMGESAPPASLYISPSSTKEDITGKVCGEGSQTAPQSQSQPSTNCLHGGAQTSSHPGYDLTQEELEAEADRQRHARPGWQDAPLAPAPDGVELHRRAEDGVGE